MRKTETQEFVDKIQKYGLEYFNLYYGAYRGIVFDNEDPRNQGRLKINIPQVYGDTESDWVTGRGIISGKGHGVHWIPSKGDPVFVSFENGNARFPVWEYGWWLKDANPANSPNEYLLMTPEGNYLKLDDDNNRVTIKTKDGNVVEMDSDGIFIGNSKFNVHDLLDNLEKLLTEVKVGTAIGPQPFLNLAQFIAEKEKIQLFLKPDNNATE